MAQNQNMGNSADSGDNANDEIVNLRLGHVFAAIDVWLQRHTPEFGEPIPTSSLGEVDRRTDPYQLSHAVKSLLSSAVDHLHALRNLTVEAQVLHRCAPTLIRPALENASVAIWMLSGDTRNERVARRLRLQWANYKDSAEMRQLLSGNDSTDWLNERKSRLRSKAIDAGLSNDQQNSVLGGIPGYGNIVRKAAEEVEDLEADSAVISWKACSGVSHGDTWAMLSINQVNVVSQGVQPLPGTVVGAQISANEHLVESMTMIAARMIQHAWSLYDLRARPWLQPPT
ncbi:hypothetical protein GCM10027447_19910 [Glycomyces halotolerans]